MALDDLPDEHEQSEKVRDWLRNNAFGLIGGLVLGLSIIGGWKWWQNHAHQQRLQVAAQYHDVVKALEAGELEQASTGAAALSGTPYGALVALDLAKAQVDAGDRDAAIATLQRAGSSGDAIGIVLRQRLARLLIDAGRAEEALSLLAAAEDAASLETRGDARFALGQAEAAR